MILAMTEQAVMVPVVAATLLLLATILRGQRAPCYECETYKSFHPQSSPYKEIRSHCSYPCKCETGVPKCREGVPIVRDGCGCCPLCARQIGEVCDGTALCDDTRGLVCQYSSQHTHHGFCKAIKGLPCTVYNQTYDNGETFMLDCRTQCACQNGTYACSSLCPQENISPLGTSCRHPRLVEVPGQCCREWMCDSETAQRPPECVADFSQWTPCSTTCGLGYSQRVSNVNPECRSRNETRLCQLRSCSEVSTVAALNLGRHHHIRKGHECKATQRLGYAVHLHFDQCRSRRRFRPRYCGFCGHGCCVPELSTTMRVEFICRRPIVNLKQVAREYDFWSPGEDGGYIYEQTDRHHHISATVDVEWVLKCQCSKACETTKPVTSSPSVPQLLLHRVHRTAAP